MRSTLRFGTESDAARCINADSDMKIASEGFQRAAHVADGKIMRDLSRVDDRLGFLDQFFVCHRYLVSTEDSNTSVHMRRPSA